MTRLLTVNVLLASWLAVTLAVGEAVSKPAAEAVSLPPSPPTTPGVVAPSPPPRADPLQRCAQRALAGEWGPLQPWQERAYRKVVEEGITVAPGRAMVTWYGPPERSARVDQYGQPCGPHTCANQELPRRTVVWIENPCGLRIVLDNDRSPGHPQGKAYPAARRRGYVTWFDCWSRKSFGTHGSRYAVLDNAGGKG